MKAIALSFLVLFSISASAQSSINNYKYVLVPEKFSFAKSNNQYGLNTLTKLLLNEKGFTAFMPGETLPAELAGNKCNALTAEVQENNSLFVTKVTLVLKDCQGNIVFKTKEGKSREKEFHTAYDMALRDAFTTLQNEPYKYDGTVFGQAQQQAAIAVTPANTPVTTATPATPVAAPAPSTPSVTENTGVLYAQATANGFQLIDTTPKKVMSLFKTSMQDYFIAVDGSIQGVVFKKNEEWLYEYYKNDKLVSQKLQIKF